MRGGWYGSKTYIAGKLSKPDEDESQIYNTNFEGNGFKYLLKVMADMLEDGRLESRGIFEDESLKMAEIVEAVRKHWYSCDFEKIKNIWRR